MSLSRPAAPLFSIIIPTYARPTELSRCLQSLAQLQFPRERFEVLVVDDGSGDPPEALVAQFGERLNVALLRQPHAGAAAARNRGAAHARGRFFVFTDDDCAPAADWLTTLAARFAATPDHLIGGRTRNALTDSPYATTSQVIVDTLSACYNYGPNHARFFASNNFAVPADHFHAIGGFDATFHSTAEDRDLCDRWRQQGYRMTYAAEAIVYHAHALTLRSFWRQHFNYGRGAFRFHQARAQRGAGPFRPELRFYRTLFAYPVRQPHLPRRGRIAALLLTAEIANAAGFLCEAVTRTRHRGAHAGG